MDKIRFDDFPCIDRILFDVMIILGFSRRLVWIFFCSGKLFVNAKRVMKSRAEVMDAVDVIIIKFGELFREQLNRQKLELKRKRDNFLVSLIPIIMINHT